MLKAAVPLVLHFDTQPCVDPFQHGLHKFLAQELDSAGTIAKRLRLILCGTPYRWNKKEWSGPQPYTRKVTQPYTRIGTRLYTRKQLSHTRETDSAIHAKWTQPYTRPNICSGHSFDDCMLPVCYYMITRRLSARDLQSMCEQMLCYV